MVRINTYYDYDIKKEAFKVSGDKGYTKSTSIVLNETTIDTSRIEYAVQNFTVNVLGDKGNSNVIIYDNDEPVKNIEWSESISDAVSFSVDLNYDVEHTISARYMGNNRCLGSKSRKISILEDTPSKFVASIERVSSTVIYNTKNITVDFKFKSNSSFINDETKTIKIYVDDVLKAETTVTLLANQLEVSGSETIRFSEGLKNILIVFEGDEHNTRAELSYNISVGYNITPNTIPDYAFVNTPLNLSATVSDFFDNPISNERIFAEAFDKTGNLIHTDIVYSDTDGSVEIEFPVAKLQDIHQATFSGFIAGYGDLIRNPYITFPLYYIDEISIHNNSLITVKDRIFSIDGVLVPYTREYSQIKTPIRVDLTNAQSDYVLSDSEGNFKINYKGVGAGDVVITASADNQSKTITIEDLLQYYVGNGDINNLKYVQLGSAIRELSTGLKISPNSGFGGFYINDSNLINKEFTIDFDVYSTSNSPMLMVGYFKDNSMVFSNGIYSNLPNSTHITIRCENNKITAYKNNAVISEADYDNKYVPAIQIGNLSNTTFAILNNIKVKVI